MSGPNTRHETVSARISAWLFNYLEKQKCKVFSAAFDAWLPVKHRRRDDIITTTVV
jgi:hypothetical protein